MDDYDKQRLHKRVSRMNMVHVTKKQIRDILKMLNDNKYVEMDCNINKDEEKLKASTKFLTYATVTVRPSDKTLSSIDYTIDNGMVHNPLAAIIEDVTRSCAIRKGKHALVLDFNKSDFDKLESDGDEYYYGMLLLKDKRGFKLLSKPDLVCNNNDDAFKRNGYIRQILSTQIRWDAKKRYFGFVRNSIFKNVPDSFKHCDCISDDEFYSGNATNVFRQFMSRVVFYAQLPVAYGKVKKTYGAKVPMISGVYDCRPQQTSLFAKPQDQQSERLQPVNDNHFIQQIIAYDMQNAIFVGNSDKRVDLHTVEAKVPKKTSQELTDEDRDNVSMEQDFCWHIGTTLSQIMHALDLYTAQNGIKHYLYNIYKISDRLYAVYLPNPKNSTSKDFYTYPTILAWKYPNGFKYTARLHKTVHAFGASKVKLTGESATYEDTYCSEGIDISANYVANGQKHTTETSYISGEDDRADALKNNKAFQNFISNI